MSTHILSSCWAMSGMSSTQKLVLISLADQANDDGVCWPSIRRMRERTCLSERAIRDAIAWLTESGVLSVSHRFNSSNVYTITTASYLPVLEQNTPPAPKAPPAPTAAPPGANCRTPRRQLPPNHQLTVSETPVEAGRTIVPAAAETPEEYLAKITKTDQATRQVVMTLDWKPSDTINALLMRAGLKADALTDEILAKFQIHYNSESRPQNKWESALVTWCKRERANPQESPAIQKQPDKKPEPDYPIGTLVLAPGHTLPPRRPKTQESIARGTAHAAKLRKLLDEQ